MSKLKKRLKELRKKILAVKNKLRNIKKSNTLLDTAKFVSVFEGWNPVPYNDPAGFATIGFGHLIALRNVTEADKKKWGRLTLNEGYKLLKADLRGSEAAVRELVKVPLTDNQISALTSFVFNVGEGAFANSTLLRLLNSGERPAKVAEQFDRWVYAGNEVMPGLVRRREAERKLFLK